jgi:hypothetical protein
MRRRFSHRDYVGIAAIAVFLLAAALFFSRAATAEATVTNISGAATDHWAWNDLIGWLDFYGTDTVTVTSKNLTGYASSTAGDVSLDCHTTSHSPPDICGQSNYQVTNDGLGDLSGWGWNDEYGWISFDCHNTGGCGTGPASSTYEVVIDPNTGIFSNYAWNDVIGWISFNCADYGGCASNYKVVTSWIATSTTGSLDSTVYDTGVAGGAQLNSVLWRGSQPGGTAVEFQFAVSSSSTEPWIFRGPDGTTNTFYTGNSGVSIPLDYTFFNNQRYFRYRVTLVSNQAQTVSPRVDDVIVNWSP